MLNVCSDQLPGRLVGRWTGVNVAGYWDGSTHGIFGKQCGNAPQQSQIRPHAEQLHSCFIKA